MIENIQSLKSFSNERWFFPKILLKIVPMGLQRNDNKTLKPKTSKIFINERWFLQKLNPKFVSIAVQMNYNKNMKLE